MNTTVLYQRIILKLAGNHCSLFCTQHSWEHRREAVDKWITHLANRMQWVDYKQYITRATKEQAHEYELMLFEHSHPREPL